MGKGIPSRFGQCEVKGKVGEGAMATVYLGEHAGLQIPVAIKVPRFLPKGDELDDEQYCSRFMREAQFAARLHHPNIVRVYDAGEQDGYFFMVMQYVDGPTVKDKLDGGECFTWREAVPIILAVSAGLQYAADEGVIHRDIKPDNIMIDRNGVPLLMDLGPAKGDAALGAHLTQSADVLGTPFYMSPEQIRNPRETDRRADIYSLGATLYHMICGEPPFGGTSIYDVMNRHMREPLRSPREMAPDAPQALCDIIAKMMAKERDDRYQDYSALIADLEHSLAGEGVAAQGAAGLLQTPEKTKGPGLTEMRAEQRYRPLAFPRPSWPRWRGSTPCSAFSH